MALYLVAAVKSFSQIHLKIPHTCRMKPELAGGRFCTSEHDDANAGNCTESDGNPAAGERHCTESLQ